jgi:hypothetical protein
MTVVPGVAEIASIFDGRRCSRSEVKSDGYRRWLRTRLQKKQTRAAKHVNDVITKQIVGTANAQSTGRGQKTGRTLWR